MATRRKPEWLRAKLYSTNKGMDVEKLLKKLELNTVCSAARCPNLGECFGRRTATFMILGRVCTRNCRFCNIESGEMEKVNPQEPENIAEAVEKLDLKHVVITSVTRDDLEDGGASHFADVIRAIRKKKEEVTIEVLIPDFMGSEKALVTVIEAEPDIINHNVETIERLYSDLRPMADYGQSLKVLENVKRLSSGITEKAILSKSGMMVGVGETEEEVIRVMKDLRNVDCDCLTIGQYLQPSKRHHPVHDYIHPDVFERYKAVALELGFKSVASGPLVRSSYMADESYHEMAD